MPAWLNRSELYRYAMKVETTLCHSRRSVDSNLINLIILFCQRISNVDNNVSYINILVFFP